MIEAVLSLLAVVLSIASFASPQGQVAATNDLASLKGATIAVDPGHNGGNVNDLAYIDHKVPAGGFMKECDTTGTETDDTSLTEASFNWDVARRLRKFLKASGAKVVLTRKNNSGVGPCINRRAQIGNHAGADVAISIHADGGEPGGSGFHVIHPGYVPGYTRSIVKPSTQLAVDIRAALDASGHKRADYIGRKGLDRRTDLGGLNLSKMPKVLAELGNMRNAGDARRLESAKWRESTARALRAGLARYLARTD